jgi:photosystem II stability/assembly factor-like uncharacterized protein
MAYEMVVLSAGGGNYMLGEQAVESLLLAAGIASVFVIPGGGPQIIFVSLFAQDLVPFSALLANAISQDGDALFLVTKRGLGYAYQQASCSGRGSTVFLDRKEHQFRRTARCSG